MVLTSRECMLVASCFGVQLPSLCVHIHACGYAIDGTGSFFACSHVKDSCAAHVVKCFLYRTARLKARMFVLVCIPKLFMHADLTMCMQGCVDKSEEEHRRTVTIEG